MNITATKVGRETLAAWSSGRYRLIANRGGTRSGKTYSLCALLASAAMSYPLPIDIVSESLPHLKRGALKDFNDVLAECEEARYIENKTDRVFSFDSGGSVRFFSVDDWGKVKGSRRKILYINEANRIPFETYRQLAVRTESLILIDWNPDAEFWYEQKGLSARPDTCEIVSTYLDNPFLGAAQIAEIESNKGDAEWWKVYGLGQVGRPMGVVFDRWRQVSEIPADAKLIGRGLDFGFTNDPTAIVAVYESSGELFVDEEAYTYGLTNPQIAEHLKGLDGWTIADSAEQKSIREIYNYGIKKIEAAHKGPDSVRAGIDVLRRYQMNVTTRSLNFIKELRNYKYKADPFTGERLNEPVDKFNHAIDALRYVALNRLAERPSNRGARFKSPTHGTR